MFPQTHGYHNSHRSRPRTPRYHNTTQLAYIPPKVYISSSRRGRRSRNTPPSKSREFRQIKLTA
ncbi:hypothetical protein E2C01_071701 [Portunus trituberculatus]|uniref:Uncharacterized protein n=1 Tax=Portunus trituberculatus TaxID=210409 RepID=A0A5B7HXP5_PORTR|nr:hypothetical protein [Portunus trituberculatus]